MDSITKESLKIICLLVCLLLMPSIGVHAAEQTEVGIGKLKLCCDQGSEFTSRILDLWAYQHQVKLLFSRPGKPTDNAFIESFNGTLRRECLNTQWFLSLAEAQAQLQVWREEYNVSRPHRALHDQTPEEFANNHANKDRVKEVKPVIKLALQLA